MATSQVSVMKLYNAVVDDVIAGVRDCFLDDGVDEQVLQELKQLWKTKLNASGAMDPPHQETAMPPPAVLQNFQKANGSNVLPKRAMPVESHMAGQGSSQQGSSGEHSAPNMAGAHPHQVLDPSNRVPVQLTLPAQPGVPGSQPRSFTIQIPAAALNGNKLHQVLTGPIISATLTLPQPLAATLLQQHINSALAEFDGGGGSRSGPAPFLSLDGALDSSDDEASNLGDGSDEAAADDDDDDDSAEERAEEEEEERDEDGGADEEPLNSEDDVSDADEPGDMFDTDNVVVCQYDKITRSRNKWKFHLKDGIMNLGGKDYVFQKANGDAEW